MNIEDKFCPNCKMTLRSHSKADLRDCIEKICPCGCHDNREEGGMVVSCQGCKCYEGLK